MAACSWVPWRVKEGRPKSIPSFQNTAALPYLPDATFDCGEGSIYCYYQYRKCLYQPVLGSLNIPRNRSGLTFIPELSCIEPKKRNALFELDYGYHGEVAEFCTNYLMRMDRELQSMDGTIVKHEKYWRMWKKLLLEQNTADRTILK